MSQLDMDHRQNDALTPREFTELWLSQRAKTAAGEPPELGTVEFIRLSDADPRKLAAVYRAALGWFRSGDPEAIADELEVELAERDAMRAELLDAAYARALRLFDGPFGEELMRRRRNIQSLPISTRQTKP